MNEIDSYKKGALVSNEIEAVRSLDLEGENLYEDCYTIQIPVVVDKKIQLIECRFKKVVTGGEWIAPDLSEVVHACAQLGEMVRIAVEPVAPSSVNGQESLVRDDEAVADLFYCVEYLRSVCEHSWTEDLESVGRLNRGVWLAMKVLNEHRDMVPEFMNGEYWRQVQGLGVKYGEPEALPNGDCKLETDNSNKEVPSEVTDQIRAVIRAGHGCYE